MERICLFKPHRIVIAGVARAALGTEQWEQKLRSNPDYVSIYIFSFALRGTEGDIHRELVENDKVEAIVVLPREMFYSTDISVTLRVLNNNKKARVERIGGYYYAV